MDILDKFRQGLKYIQTIQWNLKAVVLWSIGEFNLFNRFNVFEECNKNAPLSSQKKTIH